MNNSTTNKRGEFMNSCGVTDNIKKEAADIATVRGADKLLVLSAPGFFVIKKDEYVDGADFSIIDNLMIADEEYYILHDIG